MTYIDRLVEEKGYDLEQIFEIEKEGSLFGTNYIPLGAVVEAINSAPTSEQKAIEDMLTRIDFKNGDCLDYLKHLASALAV